MQKEPALGFVQSIQSLGTLDGPGIRFVAFLQGCPLRCGCCHNPDTWEMAGGTPYTPEALFAEAEHYRPYFGRDGGVTLSGGEPLMQAAFGEAFFRLARASGISTCLDTSGCLLNEEIKALLAFTDRVLLDIKYPTDALYRKYVGCSIDAPLTFLSYLAERGVKVTLRSVIIPTLTDTEIHEDLLRKITATYACIDTVELLPFRKLCTVKYERLGIPFRFADIPEPTAAAVEAMRERVAAAIQK